MKNNLLEDRENLSVELKDVTSSYQESEKRRKNAESALSEAQSRIGEDTSRIQELTSQNDKMKVGVACVVMLRVWLVTVVGVARVGGGGACV